MGSISALLSLISVASAADLLLLLQEQGHWEDGFHDELALSMDSVHAQSAPPDFQQAALGDQLDVVRPMLDARGGDDIAVAWLDTSDETVLRVSLAFIEAERAVIRVFDYPREDGVTADMALATREFLSSAYFRVPLPPPEPEPVPVLVVATLPPPLPWQVLVAGTSTVPLRPEAGGVRVGGEVSAARPMGRWWLEAGALAQAGQSQHRLGPLLRLRYGPAWAGLQADWTTTDWTAQLQPRLAVGLRAQWRAVSLGARVQVSPVRDEVIEAGALRYDSGWTEIGFSFGWVRKISPSSTHRQ